MVDPGREYINFDEERYYRTAKDDPIGFVEALPESVTLDEIQRVPELLPAIKVSVDKNRKPGRFLLTGSANLLLLPRVSESLAGRMEIIRLSPLVESEKEKREGRFLAALPSGKISHHISGRETVADLPKRMVQGGYPEALTRHLRELANGIGNIWKALSSVILEMWLT